MAASCVSIFQSAWLPHWMCQAMQSLIILMLLDPSWKHLEGLLVDHRIHLSQIELSMLEAYRIYYSNAWISNYIKDSWTLINDTNIKKVLISLLLVPMKLVLKLCLKFFIHWDTQSRNIVLQVRDTPTLLEFLTRVSMIHGDWIGRPLRRFWWWPTKLQMRTAKKEGKPSNNGNTAWIKSRQ